MGDFDWLKVIPLIGGPMAALAALLSGVWWVMRKFFASQEDVGRLKTRVAVVEKKIGDMPTQAQLVKLDGDISQLSERISGLGDKIAAVSKPLDLLIEHHINGSNKS